MQRIITACFASFLTLSLSAAALAQDEAEEYDFSREGPYLGLDGLLAIDNSHSRLHVGTTGGVAGRIGFRLTSQFAMELEGEWSSLEGRNPWSVSTVTKFYVFEFFEENPIGDVLDGRLQPFLVSSVGVIVGDLGKGRNPAGTFRGGLGTDFYLTNDLATTAQIVYVANAGAADLYDSINMRIGVIWRY